MPYFLSRLRWGTLDFRPELMVESSYEGIQPVSKLCRQFQDADQLLNVTQISPSPWSAARSQFQLDQALQSQEGNPFDLHAGDLGAGKSHGLRFAVARVVAR